MLGKVINCANPKIEVRTLGDVLSSLYQTKTPYLYRSISSERYDEYFSSNNNKKSLWRNNYKKSNWNKVGGYNSSLIMDSNWNNKKQIVSDLELGNGFYTTTDLNTAKSYIQAQSFVLIRIDIRGLEQLKGVGVPQQYQWKTDPHRLCINKKFDENYDFVWNLNEKNVSQIKFTEQGVRKLSNYEFFFCYPNGCYNLTNTNFNKPNIPFEGKPTSTNTTQNIPSKGGKSNHTKKSKVDKRYGLYKHKDKNNEYHTHRTKEALESCRK